MLHGNSECPIAAHRYPADAPRRSRCIHAIGGLDQWNEFLHDHVLPLFAPVPGVDIETGGAVWGRDDEFTDFPVGDHLVHDLVGTAARTPTSFVFDESVEEV